MASILLTLLVILGAAGLFLVVPGGRPAAFRTGVLVIAAAGGVLLALTSTLLAGASTTAAFGVLAVVGLWSAVRVVTHERPVYSAVYFLLVMLSVAGLLILMEAQALAAMLVIIYGGAILVTYAFVIMLAQQSGGPPRYDVSPREPLLGCLAGFVLLGALGGQLIGASGSPVSDTSHLGTFANLGTVLLTKYIVAVEIAGLLLLAAMVGALAIARRRASEEDYAGEGD